MSDDYDDHGDMDIDDGDVDLDDTDLDDYSDDGSDDRDLDDGREHDADTDLQETDGTPGDAGLDDLRFGASTPAGVSEAGNTVTWSDSFHGYYDDKTWEEQVPK